MWTRTMRRSLLPALTMLALASAASGQGRQDTPSDPTALQADLDRIKADLAAIKSHTSARAMTDPPHRRGQRRQCLCDGNCLLLGLSHRERAPAHNGWRSSGRLCREDWRDGNPAASRLVHVHVQWTHVHIQRSRFLGFRWDDHELCVELRRRGEHFGYDGESHVHSGR